MKDVIFVVVDMRNKFVHFMPLAHPYTASKVAILFLQNVFKLHGLSSSIVSNRDPVFTSHFWQELMKLQGVQLAMSSAYHPQIDGETEVLSINYEPLQLTDILLGWNGCPWQSFGSIQTSTFLSR